MGIPTRPHQHSSGSEMEVCRYNFAQSGDIWLVQFNTTCYGCSTADGRIPVGLKVWPIWPRVCEYLCGHEVFGLSGAQLAGTRCLELGAGAGLLGISLGRMGAHVTMTDTNEACIGLSRINVALNDIAGLGAKAQINNGRSC